MAIGHGRLFDGLALALLPLRPGPGSLLGPAPALAPAPGSASAWSGLGLARAAGLTQPPGAVRDFDLAPSQARSGLWLRPGRLPPPATAPGRGRGPGKKPTDSCERASSPISHAFSCPGGAVDLAKVRPIHVKRRARQFAMLFHARAGPWTWQKGERFM